MPLLLQEQNSFPGVTTRLLSRFAREVFLNFQEAASFLPEGTKWRHAGNPVRPGFSQLDRQEAINLWKLNSSLPTLLVFGGSQGAMSINKALTEILPQLGSHCNLIWSRGRLDLSEPAGWTGPGVMVVRPFIDDMPSACAAADLAVCRSGAMTLSELQAAALPAILIPYPFAAGDHQKRNAESFSKRGGALLIENRDLDGDRLLSEIRVLFDQREKLQEMRAALDALPKQDTAMIIADEMISIAGGEMNETSNTEEASY